MTTWEPSCRSATGAASRSIVGGETLGLADVRGHSSGRHQASGEQPQPPRLDRHLDFRELITEELAVGVDRQRLLGAKLETPAADDPHRRVRGVASLRALGQQRDDLQSRERGDEAELQRAAVVVRLAHGAEEERIVVSEDTDFVQSPPRGAGTAVGVPMQGMVNALVLVDQRQKFTDNPSDRLNPDPPTAGS